MANQLHQMPYGNQQIQQQNIINSKIIFRTEEIQQSQQIQCRICLEGGQGMITPCKCSGSVQFVHFKCLKQWIEKQTAKGKQKITCQICNWQYIYEIHWEYKLHSCIQIQNNISNNIFLLCLLLFFLCLSIGALAIFTYFYMQVLKIKRKGTEQERGLLLFGVCFSVVFMLTQIIVLIRKYAIVYVYEVLSIQNRIQKNVGLDNTLNTIEVEYNKKKVVPFQTL